MSDILVIEGLRHVYPATRKHHQERVALDNFSLTIGHGEIFAFLGPNGSGKSTLFRILSTLIRPTIGRVSMLGEDLLEHPDRVRPQLGIVFQHPSVDKKLTVGENLMHGGHLYNLRGAALAGRIGAVLEMVRLEDRRNDLVENLSGGMQRRVELAKCLLHEPPLLLLDEPSTGLDPGARREFGGYLRNLRETKGVSVLLTTHILDEADECDRIAILDQGKLVASGTPGELTRAIGGDIISITADDSPGLARAMEKQFGASPQVIDGVIRLERNNGHEFIPQVVAAFPGQIRTITLAKPSLEDVFIRRTGRRFWEHSVDGVVTSDGFPADEGVAA